MKCPSAFVGKYVEYEDSYKSLKEALLHGGMAHQLKTQVHWVEAEGVVGEGWEHQLEGYDGILVPGGFGKRGIDGMLNAIRYARESRVPYFGIRLGMQTLVIEYVRNVCGMEDADSTEFNPGTPHRVIFKLRELKGVDELGGTMRLGNWPCRLAADSFAYKAYGEREIHERHRHRYEFEPGVRGTTEGRRPAHYGERRRTIRTWRFAKSPIIRGFWGANSSRIQEQAHGAAPAVQGVHRGVVPPSAGAPGASGGRRGGGRRDGGGSYE